ncbi:MAG TPA: hypothetical protein VL326_20350, partial [Kofleriaceae bacterium]|nr:hypothetical protein [Kofleriaceae bacterium]
MTDERNAAHERFAAALGSESFELSRADGRWLALTRERVAHAVDDFAGWRRLVQEAWLLSRWRSAGVPAPRVLVEDPARRIQIRERMHGLTGTDIHRETSLSPLYDASTLAANPDVRARLNDAPLSPFGRRLAESYGELAAKIRRAVDTGHAYAAAFTPTSRRTLDVDAALAALEATHATDAAKQAA